MYIFEGLVNQEGEITDNWAATYFIRFEIALFPARCVLDVHDLTHERAWRIDNIFFDLRTAQDPMHIQVPQDKWWSSRLKTHLVGGLKLISPSEFPGIYGHIEVFLDLSWYPGWISIEWHEEFSFVRLTTRAAPAQGKWDEMDFDWSLLDRFQPTDVRYRSSDRANVPSGAAASTETAPETPRPSMEAFGDQSDRKTGSEEEDDQSDLASMISKEESEIPVITEVASSAPVIEIAEPTPPISPEDLPPTENETISPAVPEEVEDHAIPQESVITPLSPDPSQL